MPPPRASAMIRVMMTQQLPASILTAPLAQVDRRALSQAWYSALRLAHGGERSTDCARAQGSRGATFEPAKPDPNRRQASTVASRAARPRRSNAGRAMTTERIEQAPHSRLAGKIQRAFFTPRSRVERSTFTIEREGARVHVVVQSRGNRVRLIAVCRPADREIVARALARARYALTSGGWMLDGENEEKPCS
jgi:hypothetical protein